MGRVAVLADGAHSLGASRDGKMAGEIADFTSFSFHAVKNFTTAEGGAATWKHIDGIDDDELYKQYQLFSLHGQNKDALYVLTLDQDSICPTDIVEKYKKYTNLPLCGILCPVIDYKGDSERSELEDEYLVVGECISSASLIKVECWKKIGGFDERFFIDFVDFDFCYLIREAGYKIYQIQSIHLYHELGNLCVKKLFGRKVMVTNHSPERKYYYVRNAVLCKKKHNCYKFIRFFKDVLYNYCKAIMYEERKIERLVMMTKGLIEGINIKVSEK